MNIRVIELATLLAFSVSSIGASGKPEAGNPVSGVGFDAELFLPKKDGKRVVVLVLGGSEGGISRQFAQMLAKQGFPALALAYFKTRQTPEYLDMIPLEYFDEVMEWLETKPEFKNKKIVIVGSSKGSELALLLGSKRQEIRGVVAFAPSSVVFQGIPKVFWPPRSSWSQKGDPVPFVPYDPQYYFNHSEEINEGKLRGYYQESLKNQEAVQKAEIEVEKINGPILLFSGTEDAMWPSTEMCDMICRRLKEKQFQQTFEHVKYDDAGHTLNEYFVMGGTKEGNKKARKDSTRRMLEFLNAISAEQDAAAGRD
jgi:uncharacterized protein